MCRGFLAVPFRSTLAGYRALGGLITGGTATESYFGSRGLRAGVMAWSREIGFDAVFAFSSGIAPLALAADARRRVLCMDDLDSRKWAELAAKARWPMRVVYSTESHRLANREFQWLSSFDATIMVTPREADLISDPELRHKVVVIPPILPPVPESEELPTPVSSTGPVVGFVGAMDYEPNVDAACWLARDIWPRIRRQRSDAKLMLVGRSPTPAVKELARDESIVVTGTVPSVSSYLSSMRVHVAPLRISRGVQIKVLTAMTAGRPCVVTSCVAEGLGARAGRDLIVADSPAVLAAAVVNMLEHPDKAQAIGRAGQRFVRQLDPDRAIGRVEALLAGEDERWDQVESRDLRVETRRRLTAALASPLSD
jgi:sugar transferase (PEP-CTERM/EpsH1 system associated)